MTRIQQYRARLGVLEDWEPFLLTESRLPGPHANLEPETARRALEVVEHVTASLPRSRDRVLRQALGYCWSVAVAALPEEGLQRFERLERSDDPDIRWLVRENLKKAHLARLR